LILSQSGCNLDFTDANGWTALWHAVSDHNVPLVKLLLTSGADAMATDSDGRTLTEEAKDREMDDVCEILQNITC
jgi:ankyrin repeat protein